MVENVIYYDGECGLCHLAVRFILRVDSKGKFYFSPLSNLDNNLKYPTPHATVDLYPQRIYRIVIKNKNSEYMYTAQ